MIVDDDIVSRTKLSMILSEVGICHDFSDGATAINAFKKALNEKQPYHLVCLDILMPGMDGFDVLSEIKKAEESFHNNPYNESTPFQTKYLMVTSVNERDAYDTAMYEECIGYIIKPFRKNLIIEKLKEAGLV